MVNMNILATVALAGLAAAKTVEVKVAENGLTFTPNKIVADLHDQVVFKFSKGGHDVSSGPFNNPCKPESNSLYSGKLNEGDVFSVNVTSTNPVWIYCSVSKHCSKGMTAVINAPGDSIEAYTQKASSAGNGEAPAKVNNGSGGSGTPTTSSGSPAATTTNAASSLTFSGAAALVAMGGAWAGLL
ncbi:uncharacterized protein GIQ15_00565 [Arthroderma uncinatum]|uniref:uncharacterized protein n=1 Tax=Arthroderma uncinatum TaxID=74035 RepID=UPI00144A92C3|nr:uncharacterized protein GIQ15_00565 [Arthroderma uncinatum]KAF3491048.1 hypothetical protein GIQ15_00565 [Arthroderma uncinatum]